MFLYDVALALKPVGRLYWRMRLEGEVDSIPKTGPLILAGNHTSFLDPFVLGPMFPRRIRFLIARDWYDKNPILNRVFRSCNALPVEHSLETTIESVCRALGRGEVIGVYPEGRISYDGRIQRFRSGISYFAARSGAPVLPLGIRGVFRSLPRTRRFPRPSEITFTVGSPMRFPGSPCEGTPDVRSIIQFRDRLFREVCRLSGQEDPATFSASRWDSAAHATAAPEPERETRKTGAAGLCAHSLTHRARGEEWPVS